MNKYIERINKLIEEKNKNVSSEIDLKKISSIRECLNIEDCFFKLDLNTLTNILKYLDMPDNEVNEFYSWLLSPDTIANYQNKFYSIEKEELSDNLH